MQRLHWHHSVYQHNVKNVTKLFCVKNEQAKKNQEIFAQELQSVCL